MSILVVAEHKNGKLYDSTLHTLQAAQEIAEKTGGQIDIVVAGYQIEKVVQSMTSFPFLKNILQADSSQYKSQLAENLALLLRDISDKYTHILAPATSFGKNLMPRLAAFLDVDQVSDIISIESENIFKRPIYAGNAVATIKSNAKIKVITVRSTAFDAIKQDGGQPKVLTLDVEYPEELSQFVKEEQQNTERPDLSTAKIVISGGRGLGSRENFELLYKLAEKLGAAVGASRAAVDADFVPNDMQVGQTGKVVAPDLYMAFGISGAIQHLAGMKDSKIIVAVNKDPDSPIFQVADYGLVADLFDVINELFEKI